MSLRSGQFDGIRQLLDGQAAVGAEPGGSFPHVGRGRPSTRFDSALTGLPSEFTRAFPQLGVPFADLTGGAAGTGDGGSHFGAEPAKGLGGGHRQLP
ncbi:MULTISPECIES: hypothetical protein [Lentzea]|uniref:hypothetical protein n=1 Tax=Lentzea TaxID=165301 RepID=UPI000D6D7D1E|nr:hypothetical protein [Lentzea atacamensis]